MRLNFSYFLVLFIFFSCKKDDSAQINELLNKKTNKIDSVSFNKNELNKLVIDFFKWYENNDDLKNYNFLKGGNYTKNDSTAYYIDKKEVEIYLNEFSKSSKVSRSYVNRLRKHLEEVSQNLEKEKNYNEIVDGLDYDLITKSQDDEEIFKYISDIKLINQKVINKDEIQNYYKLTSFLYLKINFIFENKWKIDDYEFKYKID